MQSREPYIEGQLERLRDKMAAKILSTAKSSTTTTARMNDQRTLHFPRA